MPELPEVETIVKNLQVIKNHKIIKVKILRESSIAYPDCNQFSQGLKAKYIAQIKRRGKFILIYLEDEAILVIHLRMSGRLIYDTVKNEAKFLRVSLQLDNKAYLDFIDTRALGKQWYFVSQAQMLEKLTTIAQMGYEPLEYFDKKVVVNKIQASARSIKAILLDQSIVCGIGNIYADEILHLAKINPIAKGVDLSQRQIIQMLEITKQVLSKAIQHGGTSFRDYTNSFGVNGNYQNYAYVYGRKNEKCRICNALIIKIALAGRGTHFCPKCQKL